MSGTLRVGAWRFVATFGVVSLLADVVYEGARSVTGPILAMLGATAVVVGIVTGIGEAAALLLRLVSGPLADRTRRFWAWAIAGYAITMIAVPTLGFAGTIGVASLLIILERVGKAVRSPAKDALLSFATAQTGRGKGFAVHEAIDQFGAVLGPLLVAGMLAVTGVQYGPSLAVLAVPGIAALGLLFWLRSRAPHPELFESEYHPAAHPIEAEPVKARMRLPRVFWIYAGFSAATMTGFATFGLISFHIVDSGILAAPIIPLLYAAVMLVDALVALGTGWIYDRIGPRVLLVLPILCAAVPALAFADAAWAVVAGALLWGAALGIQESTLRATIADLIPRSHRATAYGVYAAVLGVAAAIGGALAGLLYTESLTALVVVTAVIQAAALIFFAVFLRRSNSEQERTWSH
ncbi:MFS transporter [Microbacterium sp.]|uniref:MFS transporter n=1 Tax=Microbacterium sp. TaxID=51671 RepID=UPI0025F1FB24|nr:MFS transporter [Microbacterium sp.]